MRLTIASKILNKSFEFFMNSKGGYIHLESPGREGSLGKQICHGGGFTGDTLSANSTNFARTCRIWYRAHVKLETSME